MEWALVHLALTVGSAGVAIILFTVGIRVVLAPLQIVQLKSARAMQRLQPKIAELRKKHGKDRQKLTEETMRLYKEHRVNPAMGCLPMLLQLPILIGLFWALRLLGSTPTNKHGHIIPVTHHWLASSYNHYSLHAFHLYHAHFLWLSNGLGATDPLFILPVLAGVTQWIQSRMMMQQSSDPQQQTMNFMMNFTPLIIVFFAWRYPSGLSLYWVTSTLIGILISMPITGWGSLPRFDQMIAGFLGRDKPQSGQGPAARRLKARPSASALLTGMAPAGADIAATNGDGVDAADAPEEEVDGNPQQSNGPKPARPVTRRRSGRPRGGRRR